MVFVFPDERISTVPDSASLTVPASILMETVSEMESVMSVVKVMVSVSAAVLYVYPFKTVTAPISVRLIC